MEAVHEGVLWLSILLGLTSEMLELYISWDIIKSDTIERVK